MKLLKNRAIWATVYVRFQWNSNENWDCNSGYILKLENEKFFKFVFIISSYIFLRRDLNMGDHDDRLGETITFSGEFSLRAKMWCFVGTHKKLCAVSMPTAVQ